MPIKVVREGPFWAEKRRVEHYEDYKRAHPDSDLRLVDLDLDVFSVTSETYDQFLYWISGQRAV